MSLNDNLFGQTYNQIISKVFGQGDCYFQMLGDPIDFVFGTAASGETDAQAYQIVSGMPAWSPIGNYADQDAAFFSAYKQVFQHVTWKVSPAQENAQNELKSAVNQKGRDLDAAVTAKTQAYITQKNNGGDVFAADYPTIKDWIAGPGKTYQGAVTAAQQAYDEALAALTDLQEAAYPPTLRDALDAMKAPTGKPANDPSPDGWTKVKDMGGLLRFRPEFVIGTKGEDWRAKLSTGTIGSFEVTLDAKDDTSDLKKSWAGADAGYDAFFWGVNASGNWEKDDLLTNDKNVKATIKVKSSTLVKVTPSVWYDGGFISDLAKGTGGSGWVLDSPWTPTGGSNSMFGKNGLLSARVGRLLVVYQPSFEITMSQDTFQKNHQKFDASLGIRIGPFHFGGSGGHESTYTHSTEGNTKFVGGSTSTDPLIVGIDVNFPGVNKP